MALRGSLIFNGYISGIGPVRVYQDIDNSKFVFCDSTKRDESYYVARGRAQARRTKSSKPMKGSPLKPVREHSASMQPTLF